MLLDLVRQMHITIYPDELIAGNRSLLPRMGVIAPEGAVFESFYAPAPYCTPSRAGLMTATYPQRLQMHHNARGGAVLQPQPEVHIRGDQDARYEAVGIHA